MVITTVPASFLMTFHQDAKNRPEKLNCFWEPWDFSYTALKQPPLAGRATYVRLLKLRLLRSPLTNGGCIRPLYRLGRVGLCVVLLSI